MKITILRFVPVVLLLATTLVSCKRDKDKPSNPDPDNQADHGFITSVKLIFTDSADASQTREFVFSDPDGVGGLPPVRKDIIRLEVGRTWLCSIKFYDDTPSSGSVDLTSQIKAQDKEHIVCFLPSGTVSHALNIERTDSDGKYEVGLESKWQAVSQAEGSVTCMLRHQVGVKDGNCTSGSTDVEVVFSLFTE